MSQNKIAGKGALFAGTVARRYKEVPVPEVAPDMSVRLRSLTAKERDDYEQDVQVKTKKGYELDPVHIREKLIIRTAVDESDNLIFGEEDLRKLADLPAVVIVRLFRAAQELCGLTEDPEETQARLK